jgi:aryl-alcohol dehydrogenase-like predicted oxidoreductase
MTEKRFLGRTDVEITPLGIGAWAWGDRLTWGYGKGYGESDVKAAFDTTLAAGIDFFDTAEIYGNGRSERMLGEFIRQSQRQVIVATKFFPFPWRLRRNDLLSALKKSLGRLGLERVDLYQIHWPFPPVSAETWMEAMADAVQAGLTRAVGVSNYSADQTRRAYEALAKRGIPLASNQVQYSLIHRQPERSGLVETCRELGVSIIAYSPIAQGLLTGKYTPDKPPPGMRGFRVGRQRLIRLQPLIELLRKVGEEHGRKTPGQVALNWLLCKGAIPIPGAKNARQAQENAGALGWQLTEKEMAELEKLSNQI